MFQIYITEHQLHHKLKTVILIFQEEMKLVILYN